MKIARRHALALLACLFPLVAIHAADAPAPSRLDTLEAAGVRLVRGPATVPLGRTAELKVPEGCGFVGEAGLQKFYELTKNDLTGGEVGVLVGARSWMLFFDYKDSGYIKDDEKNQLDAAKLLSSLSAGQEQANASRKERGWDTLKITGWTTPPHYDDKTNHLKWAINLATSRDNFAGTFINESVRLLGRGGVMNVTMVTGNNSFRADEIATDALLASNFGFVPGQKYSEFKSGDRIAAYGLGALVLGGAGVLAAKAGLFAKLGLLLAKFGKLIFVALAAIGGYFIKMWKKITGRA